MQAVGFGGDSQVIENPIVKDDFTNSICYGQTGSGKTTGYILPNIENRLKLGHGILVYDYKGTLADQVKVLAKKQNKLNLVKEIGIPWGESINILDYLIVNDLREFVENSKTGSDPYWVNAAANLIENIYNVQFNLYFALDRFEKLIGKNDISKHKKDYILTLDNLYSWISTNTNIAEKYTDIEILIKKFELYIYDLLEEDLIDPKLDTRKTTTIIKSLETAKTNLNALESYSKYSTNDEGSTSGKYGVINVLSTLLSTFKSNNIINNTDENRYHITNSLRDGDIVIINLAGFNNSIGALLNTGISRQFQEDIHKKHLKLKGVSIFIDEAQKIITSQSLPQSDICRESSFEYFLSTQSSSLLINKLGKSSFTQLDSNMVNKFSFNVSDKSVEKLNKNEYLNIITQRKRTSSPIYIDHHEIFDVLFEYQKNNNIFDILEDIPKERFIIKYIPTLYKQNKVLAIFENDTTKELNILENDSKYMINLFNKYEQKNKIKEATIDIDDIEIDTVEEVSSILPQETKDKIVAKKQSNIDDIDKRLTTLEQTIKKHSKSIVLAIGITEDTKSKVESLSKSVRKILEF